jgi:hypothetical protein
MKIVMGALAALLLAGIGWSASAEAQGVPQGSYLRSCEGAHIEGDTLVARCRRVDGGEMRTALPGINRCVGDIGNNNGQLQCSYGGPGRGPGPGYGGPGPGQAPGYGERHEGEGYGADRGACQGVHHEAEELRGRLEREFNPIERARIEGRLREVQQQEERCH